MASVTIILYVEDDPLLQADGSATLRDFGYNVLTASDGAAACALLRSAYPSVSALVTEINLQGDVEGWHVAEVGRVVNPRLAVLYTSAADRADFLVRGVRDSIWTAKPFTWPGLIRTIESMLLH